MVGAIGAPVEEAVSIGGGEGGLPVSEGISAGGRDEREELEVSGGLEMCSFGEVELSGEGNRVVSDNSPALVDELNKLGELVGVRVVVPEVDGGLDGNVVGDFGGVLGEVLELVVRLNSGVVTDGVVVGELVGLLGKVPGVVTRLDP